MMSDFMHGRADVISTVATLRRLAEDLERMTMFRPRTELNGAPHIENWRFCTRATACLVGIVHDHPKLPGERTIVTSELFALDPLPERRWARTLNRFYVLGTPAAGTTAERDWA